MVNPANPTVVAPGASDDPFTASSPANPVTNGNAPATPTSGSTPAPVTQNQPQQQQAPQQPAQQTPRGQAPASAEKPITKADLDAAVQAAKSSVQAGFGKQITALRTAVTKAQEAAATAEENARAEIRRIQIEATPEHMRAQLQERFNAEDVQLKANKQTQAATDLYRAAEGTRLLQAYGEYGVTEDDILDYTGNPTAMEDYVKGLAFERLKAGGSTSSQAASQVASAAAAAANEPAGANVLQDIGSNPQGFVAPQLLSTQGMESLAANVKALFAAEGNLQPMPDQQPGF